jgi:nucleotide-binding universal stress UspA family protein
MTPPMVVLTPSESLPSPIVDLSELMKTVEAKRTPEIEAELRAAGGGELLPRIRFKDALHADLAILDYAETERVGLIVMAKHARAAISRFLLGSTTERVLRHAKCPVLVLPVPEKAT